MKLVAYRSADYLRCASDEDRRYLLFNPIVKMKVTGQGEKVVALLHEVIAARGFEQETYFEMAIRDIGMLPKLEGTEHVNMALIIKFVKNYFFDSVAYPEIEQQYAARDDGHLFNQKTGGLAGVRFPDYRLAYRDMDSLNVQLFKSQVELFRKLLISAPPTREQAANIDYMLSAVMVRHLPLSATAVPAAASCWEASCAAIRAAWPGRAIRLPSTPKAV